MGTSSELSILILAFAFCSCKGEEYAIKNFQVTLGDNLIFTASWDTLQTNTSDSSENSSILYAVHDLSSDTSDSPIEQCANLTETSCVVDNVYLCDAGFVRLVVRATVKGKEIGRSKIEIVEPAEFENKILTAPVMNVSRDRQIMTFRLQQPPKSIMSFNPIFKIKYSLFDNGTDEKEFTTSNSTISRKTIAPRDARINVKAQLVLDDVLCGAKSTWTTVTVNASKNVDGASPKDKNVTSMTRPSNTNKGDYKLNYLIGVLIASAIILMLLVVILIKKYCRNPLHEVTVELPKDTARVIAMSEDPFVMEDEVSGLKEKISPIDDASFDSTSLLNEKGRPTEDKNSSKEADKLSTTELPENAIDEETACKEKLLSDSEEGEDVKSECSDQVYEDNKCADVMEVPIEAHIDNYVRVPEDHSIIPRKMRLESTDSAFWDEHATLPETGNRSPDSGRSASSISSSRISVDSFCSADEGYVKIPFQHDIPLAGTI